MAGRGSARNPRAKKSHIAKWLSSALALVLVSANFTLIVAAVNTAPAAADTAPTDPNLETVSAAALPTVQINGVVWNQVIVGNRVYATGQFSQARPAGAAAGTNQTPRANILAYNLTTGVLITDWAPTLNAQGMELAASADGSTIYVGGDFTQVSNQSRNRIAALDAQTGAVLPFNPGANGRVDALAVNGNTVYFGGNFTTAGRSGTATGVVARTRLAAADATSGGVLPWNATADNQVLSMVYHQGTGRVIVAGKFDNLNSSQQLGMGSLDATSGALRPWAANTVIRNHGDNSAIASLTTDGEHVFGIGWAYFGGGATANFEGAFSADPETGVLDWVDGGRGDNYDITVAGDVVYLVGHPHDWGMLDWNPQYDPYQFQHSMAIDKHRSPTLTNAFGTSDIWVFDGRPAAQPLHWLPTWGIGSYTGQYQAGWSVESNGNYTVVGGEFPRVNGTNQQGLVRFAKRAISPAVDPIQGFPELAPTVTPLAAGTVRVGWQAAWDRDNERLTFEVLRGGSVATSTVRTSFQAKTNWWNRPPLGFVDATAPPGSNQTYRIRVTDPFGNSLVGPPVTAAIPAGTTPAASTYAASVRADNPAWHWRLGETSGTNAYDRAGSNDQVLGAANARNVAGALLNEADAATNFPGTSDTGPVQGASRYWQPGPQEFSLEAWVRTSTTSGGKIIGFGDRNNARSGSNGSDRNLYMNNAGQIYFGVRPDMGTRVTINSPSTYRDNQWHHVVATLGSNGMRLYVDGDQVAANAGVTNAQVYRGYWRIGGDRLSSWPSTPAREAITANLDEIAVYPTALSAGRVREHYIASGRAGVPNEPPTAAFSSTTEFLTVTFDGTDSTDPEGPIASYAWNFGDGDTDTGVHPVHDFDTAGIHQVTLTVTDSDGVTDSVTLPVETFDPPPNEPPTASFTYTSQFSTASFTGSGADSDGTIESYAWDFGDDTTGTGANPQHRYDTGGTYDVTLTVTDDDDDTGSITLPVTVADPAPNEPPTASFTYTNQFRTAFFTGVGNDTDGNIVSYAWDFDDGTPAGSGATPQHAYSTGGTYDVTLTVTDNVGDTGSITLPVTVTNPPPEYALDAFGRTTSNGLGVADIGGAWSLSGTASAFSVGSGSGWIVGGVSANRAGFLTAVQQRNIDFTMDVALDRASTGGGAYVSVIGRRVSNGNDYRLKLRYVAGGTVVAYLTRSVGGTEATLATANVAGPNVAPGEVLRTRFVINGTSLTAKVWRAANPEPNPWLLTATDSTASLQNPGGVGVLLYVSSSWTGTAPALTMDNLRVAPLL